jgi:hypothetical protein
MNKIGLSVIIVAFKRYDLLENCIESLYFHNDIGNTLEVIVIDNDPIDFQIARLKATYPKMIYCPSQNNGYGTGNNRGAAIAKGDILLFLNPDTLFIQPIFSKVIKVFEADKCIAMAGCNLEKSGKRVLSFNFRHRFGIAKSLMMRFLLRFNIFFPKYMYTSGAAVFIRKDIFIQAGMFDEKIFMYEEELDITTRVNRLGFKNIYFRNLSIVHFEGGSSLNDNGKQFEKKLIAYLYVLSKFNHNIIKELRKEIRLYKLKRLLLGNTTTILYCINCLENAFSQYHNI